MLDHAVVDSNLLTYIKAGCCDFWTINPYKRCDHNCSYCITKAQGKSVPTFSKDKTVELIEQALEVIPKGLTIAIGGISDAYPHAEKEFGVTRGILELLHRKQRLFAVVTKGTLVERDLDLMTGNPCAKVVLSFCTLDDKLAANFDLNAPLPSRRWRTLETLVALGIETEISLKPWIPGVTDIDQILERVPSQVSIRIERLKIVRASRKFPVGNRVLSQVEIDKLYLLERAKYSGYSRLIWEMDVRFSQFSDAEEHPLELAMRQNQHEFGLLQKRGKLSPQILTEVMSISG